MPLSLLKFECFCSRRNPPAFNLGEGLIRITSLDYFTSFQNAGVLSVFDWEVVGRNLVYMAAEAVAFFALTLLIEHGTLADWAHGLRRAMRGSGARHQQQQQGGDTVDNFVDDDDVAEERARMRSSEGNGDALVGGCPLDRVPALQR